MTKRRNSGGGPRRLRALGRGAGALLIAGLATFVVRAALTPQDARGDTGPSEMEVVSDAIEFYETKFADNRAHPTFGNRLIDLYSLRFAGEADPADLVRAEMIARRLVAEARDGRGEAAARARLSNLLLTNHGFRESYEQARAAVAAHDSEAAQAALFDAALAVGEVAAAESALSELESGSVQWRFRAARLDELAGDSESAFERIRAALDVLDDSAAPRQTVAWAATRLAGLELDLGDVEEAEAWHGRALEISPDYRGAIEGLADIAYAEGRWEEARSGYLQILSDAHPDLHLRLAEVARQLDDETEAVRYERMFGELADRADAEALFAHSLAIHLARDPGTAGRALEVIERDLERRATAEGYEILAWVQVGLDRPLAALDVLDRSRARYGAGADADYIRGLALRSVGADRRAEELLAGADREIYRMSHYTLLDHRRARAASRTR